MTVNSLSVQAECITSKAPSYDNKQVTGCTDFKTPERGPRQHRGFHNTITAPEHDSLLGSLVPSPRLRSDKKKRSDHSIRNTEAILRTKGGRKAGHRMWPGAGT